MDTLNGIITDIKAIYKRLSRLEIQEQPLVTVIWSDWSTSSTVVGWTGETPVIWYKKVGKLVFIKFYIEGTSDTTAATFTLPYYNQNNLRLDVPIRVANNGAWAIGFLQIAAGASLATCYSDMAGNVWTASGTKIVIGEFWYAEA